MRSSDHGEQAGNTVEKWRAQVKEHVSGFDAVIDAMLANAELVVAGESSALRGITIQGPPGSGKSFLASFFASAVAPSCGCPECFDIAAAVAGSQVAIRNLQDALISCTQQSLKILGEASLIVLVLEKAEALATTNEDPEATSMSLNSRTVVIELLVRELRRWFCEKLPVVLLMPWAGPAPVPSELCGFSAFEAHVLLPTPLSWTQRHAILASCSSTLPLGEDREIILNHEADVTGGFLPCDLNALCRSAALAAISNATATHDASKLYIKQTDFDRAHRSILPAATRSAHLIAKPTRHSPAHEQDRGEGGLDSVMGQQAAIEILRSLVVGPFQRLVHEKSVIVFDAPIGVLITGEPGTGKTHLAVQLAAELRAHTYAASPADLLASRVGDAEKRVASLFAAARQSAPSIVILEDIDTVAPAGDDGNEELLNDPESETRVAYVLRSEIDTLRTRRSDHAKLCAGGHRCPLACEALVLVVATARDPSRVAPWLLKRHRLSQHIALEPQLSHAEVAQLLQHALKRSGQELPSDSIAEVSTAICASRKARPATIVGVCRIAATQVVRRAVGDCEKLIIRATDLRAVLNTM